MAVFTQVSAEQVDLFLENFDAGNLISLKGIAEGVENSNFLLETDKARYILTIYEQRVDVNDLPYYISLLDHLSTSNCPVPAFIKDKSGNVVQQIAGKSACLIEFMEGVSLQHPTEKLALEAGKAMGQMHLAAHGFTQQRENKMGQAHWANLLASCEKEARDSFGDELIDNMKLECGFLEAYWPKSLPKSTIHADYFPDNLLILNEKVNAIIDFYFACSDIALFDVAIAHSAWSFHSETNIYQENIGNMFLLGYQQHRILSDEEKTMFTILCRGASMRFFLSRLYDWINTPPSALVMRKDPLIYYRRLQHYIEHGVKWPN
ncbi:homoserine kinase [Sphingorhabdus lutea]|uniref:Homoserine kinase n=1 Tax=Sphingorhabdus lutea TaxID=1913578 RepID=A0A1L3JCX1_9SPHN|nr:homoserine kinase [Sphingorhabdus lutea]APG62991.1 homoserine kinase [Sphingorhabdus lutea]